MYGRFSQRIAAVLLLLVTSACAHEFKPSLYKKNEDLYRAGLREFERKKWDNAIAAFEKLTLDLPARDSLLPRSYWYLATAHEKQGEHLLAAQSYSKLVESFPDDSLADDSALEAARAYKKMWRKPALDPTYGETALATYNTLLGLYPTSPLVPQAQKELADLEDWFATKNYETGLFYSRRKAFDSAILYFKDVLTRWPNSPTARRASLSLVQAYKEIRYREDASELCTQLRKKYANDGEVKQICNGIPDAATTAATPTVP